MMKYFFLSNYKLDRQIEPQEQRESEEKKWDIPHSIVEFLVTIEVEQKILGSTLLSYV